MNYPATVDGIYYQFLIYLDSTFDFLMNQAKAAGNAIVNNPFLLITTGIMLTGAAIGIFARLLRRS